MVWRSSEGFIRVHIVWAASMPHPTSLIIRRIVLVQKIDFAHFRDYWNDVSRASNYHGILLKLIYLLRIWWPSSHLHVCRCIVLVTCCLVELVRFFMVWVNAWWMVLGELAAARLPRQVRIVRGDWDGGGALRRLPTVVFARSVDTFVNKVGIILSNRAHTWMVLRIALYWWARWMRIRLWRWRDNVLTRVQHCHGLETLSNKRNG